MKKRKSLETKLNCIVVIIGTYKFDDKNANYMPMFSKVEYLKENEFKDIHIDRKNIVNDKILKKNTTYVIIGKVIEYKNKTNYTLTEVYLIPTN